MRGSRRGRGQRITRIEHILKTARRGCSSHNFMSCVLSRGTKERNYDVRIEVFQKAAVCLFLLFPLLLLLLQLSYLSSAVRHHLFWPNGRQTFYGCLKKSRPGVDLRSDFTPSLLFLYLPFPPPCPALIQLHFSAQSALKGPHKASKISANEQPAPCSLSALSDHLCCPSLETAPMGIENSARPNR